MTDFNFEPVQRSLGLSGTPHVFEPRARLELQRRKGSDAYRFVMNAACVEIHGLPHAQPFEMMYDAEKRVVALRKTTEETSETHMGRVAGNRYYYLSVTSLIRRHKELESCVGQKFSVDAEGDLLLIDMTKPREDVFHAED